ncbi:MAG: Nif11-like leader peptide family natural product precursor [Sphaerospermopsis kisseleviana]
MSLEQVESFYEMLSSDPGVYDLYYKNCRQPGVFDNSHWDTEKIVNFAATFGYIFTAEELQDFWFANEPVTVSRQ